MLHVYHSNRLEALLALLCSLRDAAPVADPIQAETVLVANPGIGRWLNLQIAEREGIAANIDYHLPATFVWQVYRDCLDTVPEHSAFEKGPLRLRVLGLLQHVKDDPDPVWQPVRRYLQTDDTGSSDARLAQLAGRVADVFDQYLVYRPQMLLDWEQGYDHGGGGATPIGREAAWQPALWRALREGADEPHRATLWQRFCTAADRGRIAAERVPPRLHLFNVGLLPPSTLDVLVRLARVDAGEASERVSLYFLNPAVDYWADLVDMRRRARERLSLRAESEPLADDTLGNPLLASLGRTGQTLLRLLGERSEWVNDEHFFLPPADKGLLAALQRDLLHPFDAHEPGAPCVGADPSIQFHGHYSVLREVQALHDQLLQRFNADASLEPAEVLVMVPDINGYAPVIEAVFGSVGGVGDAHARHIPWSIADRSLTGTAPVIALVSRLFELPHSDFEASDVLAIASERAVARRFGFDDNGLATVQQWLHDSGIRRSLAGEHDTVFGARDAALNSWDFGLRRLLLGRAVPDETAVLGECEPWPHVDGEHAVLLSQLLELLDTLRRAGRELSRARTVPSWVDAINELIDRMLLPDEDEADALAQLRELLATLDADATRITEHTVLSHDSMRELLRDTLASATRKHHRYLTGRVTFSSMVPLRSVPFRMVCLLGMNDGEFPRQRPQLGFDLIARHPAAGDRSVRDDDKYLFLEAILSARDELYISWLHRSPQDNTAREASVLVGELRDHLAARYPDERALEVLHPLQPFSPVLFDAGGAARTYADEWHLDSGSAEPAARLGSVERPHVHDATLALADLQRFWRDPSAWYCREVLGLSLQRDAEAVADSEPFVLDALTRYGVHQTLIAALRTADPPDARSLYRRLVRQGVLPHGAAGERSFDALHTVASAVVAEAQSHARTALPSSAVTLALDGVTLVGRLEDRVGFDNGTTGRLTTRASSLKGRDLIQLLVAHLVGTADGLITGPSVHVARERSVTLAPMDPAEAAERLRAVLAEWRAGQCGALPFFADSSPVLAGVLRGDPRTVWLGGGHAAARGEAESEAIHLLYPDPGAVLAWDAVQQCAQRVFADVDVHEAAWSLS